MCRAPRAVTSLMRNRLGLELAEVEKHQLERQILRAPQGVIGAKANVPVLVVRERLQLRDAACGLRFGKAVSLATRLAPRRR